MTGNTLLLALCVAFLAFNSNEADSQYTYMAFLNPLQFFEAWQDCNTVGGHLASIESPEQQNLVEKAINKTRNPMAVYFIGGTDIGHEGRWMWIGLNKPFEHRGYRNFYSEEAVAIRGGHACLVIGNWDEKNRGKWVDVECTNKADGYVCAFPFRRSG